MADILFLAPHPDDEAIFNGGTIVQLANNGHNVHVIFATTGELGHSLGVDPVAVIRKKEAEAACEILGVKSCHFIGFQDSGLDPNAFTTTSFAAANISNAVDKIVQALGNTRITTIVFDDQFGTYGHPDHKQAHAVGMATAQLLGIGDCYWSTIDPEQLHYAATHLVEEASESIEWLEFGPDGTLTPPDGMKFGYSSVEITHTVRVHDEYGQKEDAIGTHASQIAPDSIFWKIDPDARKIAYGTEWYVRANIPNVRQPDRSPFHDLTLR